MHPLVDATTVWRSIILVNNIHCASCVSYIRELLAPCAFGESKINVLTGEVQVVHSKDIPTIRICAVLDDAFEVYHATTRIDLEEDKQIINTIDIEDLHSMRAREGPLLTRMAPPSRLPLKSKQSALHHSDICGACKGEKDQSSGRSSKPFQDIGNNDSGFAEHGYVDIEKAISSHGTRGTVAKSIPQQVSANETDVSPGSGRSERGRRKATLSIGGMTCASCTGAVTTGLRELDFVEETEVTLMTNSAMVMYTGECHLSNIVETVEDLGYDCEVDNDVLLDMRTPINDTAQWRQISLKIEGMFCKHCPSRITDSLAGLYGRDITIDHAPSISKPVITISYQPASPNFTIRHIVAAIDQIDPSFKTSSFRSASVEERSRRMQQAELRRLMLRVLLSFVVAIPTFLIGVVWMSLVPSTNSMRRYFDTTVWKGNVSRREWALFILATPVMFFAAGYFHVRAIKEIRSLWRRNSRVPIAKRFYRFGSMNLLVSTGTSVAYFSSVAILALDAKSPSKHMGQSQNYFDSVIFLSFFILLGRWLEVYSKTKTGDAVTLLGQLKPEEAVLITKQDSGLNTGTVADHPSTQTIINADLLEAGDVVLVRHGASPPADGVIEKCNTQFNESSLTGEALPVSKTSGDKVFAGALNIGDATQVRVTEIGGSSMLDQIVSVVREGQTKRAPVERIVDIVTAYFVPVITALAILTWIIWLALGQSGALDHKYLTSSEGGWLFWSLEFAIAVFVVACPCGIGLAAPTALFVGSGLAAKHGILVRGGGEAFQAASRVDAVVSDKTGTLTEGGNLKVTDYELLVTDGQVKIAWEAVRLLEEASNHPLARALHDFASSQVAPEDLIPSSVSEIAGKGLRGILKSASGTYEAALGSEAFIKGLVGEHALNYFSTSILSRWKHEAKSVAILALRMDPSSPEMSWQVAAFFSISDPIRASTVPTLQSLRQQNIPIYMLTGDNPTTAAAVASTIGIPADHVFAGVLPTEKAHKIQWLQDNLPTRNPRSRFSNILDRLRRRDQRSVPARKAVVAFVGDGTNDAPALTAANVSIALAHPSASDIALTSASFIILSGAKSSRGPSSPSSFPPPQSVSNGKEQSDHNGDIDTIAKNDHLYTLLTLLNLSSRVFRRVKFNFAWACIYNAVLVPVAAGVLFRVRDDGWRLGPVWGSAAMAASSVSVVLSSMALRLESWEQLRFWKRTGK